eukprot:TRINITY_DN2131_c0_g1_i1.p1 TRINITY_DN2131_c0_g1~~TRINITY_DN2131_c0_g1_i1.p1  ORF type:complete len:391 (-),score=102.16 TRINITY_DN2131_c0_g1_i1:72-1244(-)
MALELLRSFRASEGKASKESCGYTARSHAGYTSRSKDSTCLSSSSHLRLCGEDASASIFADEELQVECRIAKRDWNMFDGERAHAIAHLVAIDVGAMYKKKLRPDVAVQSKSVSQQFVCSRKVRLQRHNRAQVISLRVKPQVFIGGVGRILLQIVLESSKLGRDRWNYVAAVPVTVLPAMSELEVTSLSKETVVLEDEVLAQVDEHNDAILAEETDADALVAQALAEEEEAAALAKNTDIVAQALLRHMQALDEAQKDLEDTRLVEAALAENEEQLASEDAVVAEALAELAEGEEWRGNVQSESFPAYEQAGTAVAEADVVAVAETLAEHAADLSPYLLRLYDRLAEDIAKQEAARMSQQSPLLQAASGKDEAGDVDVIAIELDHGVDET